MNWANLIAHVPEPELVRIFSESSLISLVNWTMLTQMSGILQELLTESRRSSRAKSAGCFSISRIRPNARLKTCSRS